ncbi:MAG: replicative DNA helicase [Motilibacteraceae bacterium]
MSVAELSSTGDSSYQPSYDRAPLDRTPLDRTPPQDVAAEQSVLGAMLLSKDAIADVVEVLRGNDFYRPAHELVYEAILDLYGRGEPADAVTVVAELTRRGELGRVGGPSYVHTLLSMVPTAANAGFYAQIVRERAILRRLVEAGTRIVQLGYAAEGGDADDIVDRAQAEIYGVTEKRASEDYAPLADIMEGALDEIEAIGSRGGQMVGVPTGFTDLDQLTNGLHGGQMIVIAARPAVGKALALDTPLPTPGGWTTMGEVQVGDFLIDAKGRPTQVVRATEVMTGRPCFEVHFSDGTVIVADADHQWLTETRASRKSAIEAKADWSRTKVQRTTAAVRTTEEIARTVRCETADRRLNHSVPLAAPLQLPAVTLALPPYALGVWLGDGTSAAAHFTSDDPEIAACIEAEGLLAPARGSRRYGLRLPVPDVAERSCVVCGRSFRPATSQVRTCGKSCGGRAQFVSSPVPPPTCPDCGSPSSGLRRCDACHRSHGTVQAILRALGVLHDKHVPSAYLRSSESQRRALLAGLLDTDGTVTPGGCVQFAVTSERLARDVHELIVSLGYRCGWSRKPVKGRTPESSVCHTLTFSTDDDVFRLERKRLLHKERRVRVFQRRNSRFITKVVPVDSVPVRCVEVDNEEHLYLAGRTMVPTHNSTLGLDIARSAAIKNQLTTVIFSLEMGRNEITMRLLSAEARVPLHHMRSGTMSEDDWNRLARRMGEVSSAPLFIDDSPNMSMMEIRAKCRRLKQRHDLKLVVIDYLQLMSSGKRVESRQQEVAEFSRGLKLLAKELEVPVIAMSQLNRGSEQRTDKKPQMSDLRESGCLTADTRVLRADTGSEVTLGELLERGETDVPVWSLDDSLRYVRRHLTHVFSTGHKEVFRLRLASGKEVRATANHPFLTYDGWRQLGDLAPGARLAVPRHVPAPEHRAEMSDAEVALLATAVAHGGSGAVPTSVPSLPKAQIALFVRSLWSQAGTIRAGNDESSSLLSLSLPAGAALEDVARLLLRFGIASELRPQVDGSVSLTVTGRDERRRFLQEIGVGQAQQAQASTVLAQVLETVRPVDSTAPELWDRVRSVLNEDLSLAAAIRQASFAEPALREARIRQPMGAVAAVLEEQDLEVYAVNDVLWDEVVSIQSEGVQEVYDATVVGTHNFIANGIAVHNSIEQDADMVILLHREELYEKESPRAGEADFIVAKHRNGPTATITVAFQGHYSRFVDMAQM